MSIINSFPNGGDIATFANAFSRGDIIDTTERIVGMFMGKPMYQKVIEDTLPNEVNVSKSYDVGAFVDTFVSINAMYYSDSGYQFQVDSFGLRDQGIKEQMLSDSSIKIGAYNHSGNTFSDLVYALINSSTWLDKPIRFILRYTKTTDTANAIKYGTGNDYSLDEQIVGTWIDGKPLYQRCFVDTFPEVGSTKIISIGARVEYATSDVSVYSNNGVIQNLNAIKNAEATINWILRYYIYKDDNGTNKNSIALINYGGSQYSNQPVYITLRYTKTTD